MNCEICGDTIEDKRYCLCDACQDEHPLLPCFILQPLECVYCGSTTGPLHPLDADHAGWMCPKCYDALKKGCK